MTSLVVNGNRFLFGLTGNLADCEQCRLARVSRLCLEANSFFFNFFFYIRILTGSIRFVLVMCPGRAIYLGFKFMWLGMN